MSIYKTPDKDTAGGSQHHRKTSSIYLAVIFILLNACDRSDHGSDPGAAEFVTLFGAENADAGYSLIETAGDGIIIAGSGNGTVGPADGTISSPMISKLGQSGYVEWTTLLPDRYYLNAAYVVATSADAFLLLFRSDSGIRLAVINNRGDVVDDALFEKEGASVYGDRAMIEVETDLFVIVGSENGGTFLTKIDSRGTVIWDRKFPAALGDANSVALSADNGLVVFGDVDNSTPSQYNVDLAVFKTDSEGILQWARTYGSPLEQEKALSIIPSGDGKFILAGQTTRDWNSNYNFDEMILEIDANGALEWRTDIESSRYSSVNALTAVAGRIVFTGNDGPDISIGRLSPAGELLWKKTINPYDKHGWGSSITELNNGKFAVTGSYGEGGGYGGGEYDAFLIIVDENGNLE